MTNNNSIGIIISDAMRIHHSLPLSPIQVMFLFGLIIRKYKQYKEATSSRFSATINEEAQMENMDTLNESSEQNETKISSMNSSDPVRNKPRTLVVNLGSRFTLAIILTVLLFLCVLPIAVSVVLDKVSTTPSTQTALIISALFFYVYTTACPILMVKYLPSLKSALIKTSHNLSPF